MSKSVFAVPLLLTALSLHAQDTRTVTEPTVPATCTVLSAALHAAGNTLAAADEIKLDTARVQAAIDGCAAGHAVELRAAGANNAFLSGPLELREGVTLLIDGGVTLYASRNPADFDSAPGTCGISGPESRPCKPLISVRVRSAAVMGPGTIDGRGDKAVLGKPYTWWQQSRAAQPTNAKYSAPRLIIADHADGFTLYRIRLHNAPNFHVVVGNTDGFTAWDVHIRTPTAPSREPGNDARNTDGIDPGNSQNITVAESWIDNGDDNIAIKQNVHHMSVLRNHFYRGHGMSIGSEARDESDILVDTLSLDHTTSGIRIKGNVQRGGIVRSITYRDVCMQNVPVPLSISPFYTGQSADGIVDLGMQGTMVPDFRGITLQNVLSTTPGKAQVAGLNAEHPTELMLDGVFIRGMQPGQAVAAHARITNGPQGTNLAFRGDDVQTEPAAAKQTFRFSCDGKFPAYQP